MNSTWTWGRRKNEGDNEDDDGGQHWDSSGYLMGLEGVKGKQGKGQYNGYCHQCGQLGHAEKELVSEQQQCATTVDSGGCKSATQKIGPTCPQIQTPKNDQY